MLDMVRIDSVDYYDELAKAEYYAKGNEQGEPAGKWGKGIEKIGLVSGQEVESADLRKIMAGFGLNDEKLTQNAGQENFRVGMDLTFSAPKSVSILWANADPELRQKISEIHEKAIHSSMEYMRQHTEARRGHNGTIKETPSALIYATFEHCDTRAKDPQLHGHCVVSNSCVREDGTTGAIDQNGLYQHKLAAGAKYREDLARDLRGLGFKLEADPSNPQIFRICGMPDHLEKHFSKRSVEIKQAAEKTGMTSPAGRRALAASTRDKKVEINRNELFGRWQKESAERGFDAHSIEELKALEATPFEMPTPDQIIEKLTEQESFFEEKDIDQMGFQLGQYLDIDQAKFKQEILTSAECQKRAIFVNTKDGGSTKFVYTSKSLAALEEKVISQAQARSEETAIRLDPQKVEEIVKAYEAEQGFTLREEQREAVKHLTSESGGIALMRGLAGTGKTTALKPTVDAFKAAGYEVHGATISAKAAQVLSAETGLNGGTIAQMVRDLDTGKLMFNARSVLVIDEAGMVGSRDFSRLQSAIDDAGGKLIAVGDEKQLQAISSGGIFEALQFHGNIKTADLTTITRQKDDLEKQASKYFYDGKAEEALKIYEEKGAIKTHHSRGGLIEMMARDFAKDPEKIEQKMAITATNNDARMLNESIREHLKSNGQIDEKENLQMTNADGFDLELSKGDRILFKQNSKGLNIKNNQSATIKNISTFLGRKVLTVELDNKETKKIDLNEYNHIRHGYAITTHSSQGATVNKSFYLFNRGADLSAGYVGMTRHKDGASIYATNADRQEMAARLGVAHLKATTLDLGKVQKMEGVNASSPQASSVGGGQQAAGQMPQTASPAPTPAAGASVASGAFADAAKIMEEIKQQTAEMVAKNAEKSFSNLLEMTARNKEIEEWGKQFNQPKKEEKTSSEPVAEPAAKRGRGFEMEM